MGKVAEFDIWEPRWRDKTVLLACSKVRTVNHIRFTNYPKLPGVYYVAGAFVKRCEVTSNGTIACYAVPLSELKRIDTDAPDPEQGVLFDGNAE